MSRPVASKFVSVGSIVPAVRQGVGAVATQAMARWAYRDELLDALAAGAGTADALRDAVAGDDGRDERQVGVVGPDGAATYTGPGCLDWAGGRSGEDATAAWAIQGNILTGPEVVDAMEDAFVGSAGRPLDQRLLAALLAGDDAGGDRRGRQSAALLVLAPGAGYDGCGVVADLRVDDHPEAPSELARVHAVASLVFGGPEDVEPLTGTLREEVAALLSALGQRVDLDADHGVEDALEGWMGEVNLENRQSPAGIDARVLAELRTAAGDLTSS